MRIALIDDHPIVRSGLRWLLEQQTPSITVVAEAGDCRSAYNLEGVDVFVVDLGLPDSSGFVATTELMRLHPEAHVLVLTMHAREDLVARAFAAGATGYALKEQPGEELAEAIATVARGERYVAPKLRTPRLSELLAAGRGAGGPLSLLSSREREGFDLLARGLDNKDVARRLFISVKTVETHRAHIFRKLGVHGIAELVRLAVKEGAIVEP